MFQVKEDGAATFAGDITIAGSKGLYGFNSRLFMWTDTLGTFIKSVDNDATNGIHFQNYAGTEIVTFLDSGNVGIGTNAPIAGYGSKLEIKSTGAGIDNLLVLNRDAGSSTLTGVGSKIVFAAKDDNEGPSETGYIRAYHTGESFAATAVLQFSGGNSGNPHMTINNSGKVGIGTTAPGAPLHINGSWAGNYGVLSVEGPLNGLNGIGLRSDGTYESFFIFRDGTAGNYLELGTTGDYPMYFETNGHNQRMTITGAGNIGIGTTAPAEKLDIYHSEDVNVHNKIVNIYAHRGSSTASGFG